VEVGLGFAGTGALILAFAAFLFRCARNFGRKATTVAGTVVAQAESTTGEGRVRFAPVVQFATAEGRTVRFTDRLGTNPPSQAVGDTVAVSYDPADPERARIAGSDWFLAGLFTFIGGAFLLAGLIVLLVDALV
jgi:hypothetical protein